MTLAQAAAFYAPSGRHRGRHLALIAADDPAYLIRQAERPDREVPEGSAFHEAVRVVADRLINNYVEDILAGRVVRPDEFTRADHPVDGTFGTAGTEAMKRSAAKRGRHYQEPEPTLFSGLK